MRIEPIVPIYKSTFNSQTNSDKNKKSKQDRKSKDEKKENQAVILEISAEGRKKLEEFER